MMAYIISAVQHCSLHEIGEKIQAKLLSDDAIAKYHEWVSMHDNPDQALHESTVDALEQQRLKKLSRSVERCSRFLA